MLHYIFLLGTIFFIFSALWAIIMFSYKLIVNFRAKTIFEKYFFEAINIFILISISALLTEEKLITFNKNKYLIVITGMFVIYTYLTGRLQPKRIQVKINNYLYTSETYNPFYESLLIITGIVYFSFCLTYPFLAKNQLSLWFYQITQNVYNTPVLGHIAACFGFLFMIYMIFQSMFITMRAIHFILKKISGQNDDDQFHQNGKYNSDFDDFELMEDEKK